MKNRLAQASFVVALLLVYFYPFLTLDVSYIYSARNFTKNVENLGIAFPLNFYAGFFGISNNSQTVPNNSNEDTSTLYSLYSTKSIEDLVSANNLNFLDIKDIDLETKTFGVVSILGKNSVNMVQYTTIDCPSEKTWVVNSKNKILLESNVSLYEKVEVNDSVLSYCMDSDCRMFGKECVVVKSNSEVINETE